MRKNKRKASSPPTTQESGNTPDVIDVPQPAPGSYDPSRPLSKNTLLLHQVRQFQLLEQTLPQHRRSGHDHQAIRTEGDAAEYLRKMTKKLHPQGAEQGQRLPLPSEGGTDE